MDGKIIRNKLEKAQLKIVLLTCTLEDKSRFGNHLSLVCKCHRPRLNLHQALIGKQCDRLAGATLQQANHDIFLSNAQNR